MTPANFECKLRNILKDFGVTGKSKVPLVPETGLDRWNVRRRHWSGRLDLNQRPPAPKAGALPGCATPRLASIITISPSILCDLLVVG